jgi:NUMOD4 motif-containing protein/HNH endonuclease
MGECTTSDERWRPVVGFELYYEVSDLGRVRSLDRLISNGTRSGMLYKGKMLKPTSDPDGRQQVSLSINGVHYIRRVHGLVLGAFIGPRPEGLDGCHENGNARDNRLVNLRWDTRSSNMFDCVRHGTDPQRNRTCCPQGHLLMMPNLVTTRFARHGHRVCRSCAQARSYVWTCAHRGRVLDFQTTADRNYKRIMAIY